jgi:hypothetical protein
VRLAVVGSILVHFAVIAAAYRLPVRRATSRTPVEVEIHQRKIEVPVVAPLTPPIAPAQKLAMTTTPRERRATTSEPVRAVPLQPMETQPPSTSPPDPNSPAATVPERKGPVDLTLHGLPSTGEWATPGAPAVAPPSAPARKAWKPRGDAGDPILGKLADKKEEYVLEPIGRDGFMYNGPQFSAHISLDGSVSFDDKLIRDFKGLSGGFDLTDMVMKGKKEDPYRHEKKKFLEATAGKRAELAKKARDAEIERSLAELPWHCDEIWRDRYRTPTQRRKTLYALWREADAEQAGQKAREIIEGYVRRYLPQGTADAFTDEELAKLNAAGGPEFNPYH